MFNTASRNSRRIFIILISACVSFSAFGQSFRPDRNGYIADPLFHKAIKAKGYQMVGAFDTIRKSPLEMVAFVVANGKLMRIGLDANVTSASRLSPIITRNENSSGNGEIYIDEPVSTEKTSSPYETLSIGGKYGTINKLTKKVGLPAIYDRLSYQLNGYIEIKQGENVGLAKADGTVLVSPRYDNISMIQNYGRATYSFWKNEKFGLLDHNGKEVIKAEYDQIYACYDCDKSGNLLIIRTGKKVGLASNTGKIILPPTYDNISALFKGTILRVKDGRNYGLIDSLGKVKLVSTYSEIKPDFENKILRLSSGAGQPSYGLADSRGNIIAETIYRSIGDFERGFARVYLDEKVGLINKNGDLIIKPEYSYLHPESRGIIATKDGKTGLLNLKGQVIIPLSYTQIAFVENNLFYQKDNVFGIMNLSGNPIQKMDYDDVEFTGKYFIVKKDGKFGVFGNNLKPIFPIKYDAFQDRRLGFLTDGVATAIINEIPYVIDRYGNQIPESEFEAIRSGRPAPRSAAAIKAHNENLIHTLFNVDKVPSFKPGVKFEQFIRENLNYSEKSKNFKGSLYVSFVIEKDGSIGDISYDNRLCSECQNELTRVIKSSPVWKPAIKDGKPVRVSYPMKFAWVKPVN